MYAVRPMLMTGCTEGGACGLLGTEGPLHLAGYGVELAIKNMEYSALDDSQVSHLPHAFPLHPVRMLLEFSCPIPLPAPTPELPFCGCETELSSSCLHLPQ